MTGTWTVRSSDLETVVEQAVVIAARRNICCPAWDQSSRTTTWGTGIAVRLLTAHLYLCSASSSLAKAPAGLQHPSVPLHFCCRDISAGPTSPPDDRGWPRDELILCQESLVVTSAFWPTARCLYLASGSDHIIHSPADLRWPPHS